MIGKNVPCSTRMMAISRITTDGVAAGSCDFAIEPSDMSE